MAKQKSSRSSEYTVYEEYGEVGREKTAADPRKDDEQVDSKMGRCKKVAMSLSQPSTLLKLLIAGFLVIIIPCFIATFNFISQLRQDITALQMNESSTQRGGTVTTTVAPLFVLRAMDSRILLTEEERIAKALEQLDASDWDTLAGLKKLTDQFEKLKFKSRKSFLRASEKIKKGSCRLDRLMEVWAIPTNTISSLLATEGWLEAGEAFYYRHSGGDVATYAEAKFRCSELGGRLASTSLRFNAKFSKKLEQSWIGYDDIDREGFWVWSDGAKTLYPGKIEWHHTQPENFIGEDCAVIGHIVAKFLLYDAPCDHKRSYICEKEFATTNKVCPKL